MKKTITFFSIRAAMMLLMTLCSMGAGATITGSGTQDDPYIISSVDDWDTFANSDNANTYWGSNVYVGLGADIPTDDDIAANKSITTMVGTSTSSCFQGTFDGFGHTLTVNLTHSSGGDAWVAPFKYIYGATIKQLHTAGNITTNGKMAGGIVGDSWGTSAIENCQSSVTIYTSVDGDGTHGGLVGRMNDGELTITNCLFDGSIIGSSTTNCGGFVGWREDGTTLNITNCRMAGTFDINVDNNSATFSRNGVSSISNSYYTTALGIAQGVQVFTIAPESEISKQFTLVDGNNYYVPCTITGINTSYPYTGETITVTPIVKDVDGNTLTKDTHYTIAFTKGGNTVSEVKELGTYTITITAITSSGYAGEKTFTFMVKNELTVYDGTDNNKYIPVHGYYADTEGTVSEFVIPSGQLKAMAGGTISELKFYLQSPASEAWTGKFKVYLKEIDEPTLTGITGPDDDGCTLVYTGTLDATGSVMTVTFDDFYTYNGGNLLMGSYIDESGNWEDAYFYGVEQSEKTAWYDIPNGSGGAQQFIPKTTFTYTPSGGVVYYKPSGLTLDEVDANTATLSWTAPTEGTVTGYAYQYKKTTEMNWSAEETVTNTSVALSELTANTAYNFRVKAKYSDDGESHYTSITFLTDCEAITTFPWTEDFENFSASSNGVKLDEPCWQNEHISGNGSYFFEVYSDMNGSNSTNQLCLPNMAEGTMTKLRLPVMNLPDNSHYLFALDVYRNDNYNSKTDEGIRVFASTDGKIEGAQEMAFIPRVRSVGNSIISAESADDWYTYELPIPVSGTCYIILRGENQFGTSTYMDNFEVKVAPSCISPIGLIASNVTSTSATLSWTERGSASAWVLQYGTDENFTAGTYTETTVSTNPTTNLTELTPESTYYARVKPECDTDVDNWSKVFSFLVTATEEIILNDGTGSEDYCPIYGSSVESDTKSQFIIPATALEDDVNPGSTIKRMYFYTGESNQSVNWGDATFKVYMKEVDYETFATASYEDWTTLTNVYSGSLSVSNHKMEVIFDNDYTYNGGNLLIGFQLDSPGTNNNVSWLYASGSGNNCVYREYDGYVDRSTSLPKVSLRFLQGEVTCKRPRHLTVSDVAAHGATINWESDADAWQIMLDDDAQNLIDVDEKTYTFTGLDAERTYTAKVRTNCGSNSYSAWSIPVTFEPTAKVTIGSGTDNSGCVPIDNSYSYSLTQQIYTVAELGGAGLIESIDFYKNSTYFCRRKIDIYMVNTSKSSFGSESDWISVTDADLVFSGAVTFADNDWTSITLDNPFIYDGTQNVAIIVDDNSGFYEFNTSIFLTYPVSEYQSLYYCKRLSNASDIDPSNPSAEDMGRISKKNQIRILKSPFGMPENFMATKVGPTQATLTWVETGAATKWVVAYKKTGDATFTEVHATTNSYTLTGLSNETAYTVKVRPANNDDLWSSEITFTTTVDNPVPTDVAVSDISHTSATVNWTGFGESYNVRYRMHAILEEGFENGLGSWTMQNQESRTGVNWSAANHGSNGFMFRYNSNPPQYLISPEITKECTLLEFYYKNFSIYYQETFHVGFSSTTNSIDDFDFGDEITAADAQWHLCQVPIPAGTKYICWKLTSNDQYCLCIDDIVVSVTTDWTNTSVTEESLSLEGLTAGITYHCQVQSVKGEETTDWSPVTEFTIPLAVGTLTEAEGVTYLTTNASGQNDVPVEFSRSFTMNVASTICLPFPMTRITGGKVYQFVGVEYDNTAGWVATMSDATPDNKVTSTEANKPYLFMPTKTGNVTFRGTIASVPAEITAGYSTSGDWTFRGTYSRLTYEEDESNSNLFSGKAFGFAAKSKGENAVRAGEFVRAATNAYVPAFRAFLKYKGDDPDLQARATRGSGAGLPDRIAVRLLGKNGEIDGIGEIRLNTGEVTFDSNAWYDLNGRKLDGKPTQKGIYINGGHKVVIK